jgi:hypothetical protein
LKRKRKDTPTKYPSLVGWVETTKRARTSNTYFLHESDSDGETEERVR